jgi:AmmeMemoRadiSam system protein A
LDWRLLSEAQKATLVELARRSIEARVTGDTFVIPELPEFPDVTGVFVTIKRGANLRGCLGTLENRRGLAEEVVRCAADSATVDPRFAPVATDELTDMRVEVSVLGPLQQIEPSSEAFAVGVHGLIVEQGARRGLLLPQVATEWGWTAEQFLGQTCVKAGLRADAWQRGATLYRFSAQVFGD